MKKKLACLALLLAGTALGLVLQPAVSFSEEVPRSKWTGACGEVKSVKKGKNGFEEFRFDIYEHVDHGAMMSVNFIDTFFNDGSDKRCRGVIKPGAQLYFNIKHKKDQLWIYNCDMGL